MQLTQGLETLPEPSTKIFFIWKHSFAKKYTRRTAPSKGSGYHLHKANEIENRQICRFSYRFREGGQVGALQHESPDAGVLADSLPGCSSHFGFNGLKADILIGIGEDFTPFGAFLKSEEPQGYLFMDASRLKELLS